MSESTIICYNKETLKPVEIPEQDRFLNMLVVGPTGTGKTSQIFVPMIFQDLMAPNVGVTIFDPKEDLSKKILELSKNVNKNVVYIDPLDVHCPKVDLFRGSANTIINTLNKIFTPIDKNTSSIERANVHITRSLIEKSINLLKDLPYLCGNSLNIDTYCEFLQNKGDLTKLKLQKALDNLKGTDNTTDIDICEWFTKQFFSKETDIEERCYEFKNRIEELSTNYYMSEVFVSNSSEARNNAIDFDKHLANGDIVIINTRNTVLGYLGKTFGEILMYLFTESVFRRLEYQKQRKIRHVKPNFLYIDEFATFNPVTIDLFTQGRFFRVGTHITIQNRTLLKMCGGLETSNEAFVIESNTRNLILFPGLNGEDADYYSKQFFNIKPAEILYRPFGQIVYRIIRYKNVVPPSVGLVFFVDEVPNGQSIAKEYTFDKDGNILWKKYDDYINEDFEEFEHTTNDTI